MVQGPGFRVRQATYSLSGVRLDQYPQEGLPEIALVGRSNVGKSSLVNALLQRRALARTSSQPGKTQTANFYLVEEAFYFVDLPGYGYAKTSKTARAAFSRLVADYLEKRRSLRVVLQIVDLRHPPSALDREMYAFLGTLPVPALVVANKLDKLKRTEVLKQQKIVLEALPGLSPANLYLFSSQTKQGAGELWQALDALLEES